MALFRVTVTQMKNTNGIRVEKGMRVEVVTNSLSNPLTTNGGRRWPMLSIVSMALMPREQESFRPSIWMYNGLDNA